MHQRSHHRHVSPLAGMTDLSIGLTRDALWLRTEDWRLAFSDTATLCLASLLGLSLLSTLIALALAGSWDSLRPYLRDEWMRSLIASPHVLFVLLATASRRHTGQSSITRWLFWIKRQFFFVLKTLQILLLAFLLSVDVCVPLHRPFPLHRRSVATLRLCLLRTDRPALGHWRPGATLQAVPAFTHHTRPCRPAFAQSSGVEWHRTELQTRTRSAQHSRNGDKLVSIQPLDQPRCLSMTIGRHPVVFSNPSSAEGQQLESQRVSNWR